jgi:hypothetical protein
MITVWAPCSTARRSRRRTRWVPTPWPCHASPTTAPISNAPAAPCTPIACPTTWATAQGQQHVLPGARLGQGPDQHGRRRAYAGEEPPVPAERGEPGDQQPDGGSVPCTRRAGADRPPLSDAARPPRAVFGQPGWLLTHLASCHGRLASCARPRRQRCGRSCPGLRSRDVRRGDPDEDSPRSAAGLRYWIAHPFTYRTAVS